MFKSSFKVKKVISVDNYPCKIKLESKHGGNGGYTPHDEEEEEKKEGPGVKSYTAKDNGYEEEEEDRGSLNSGERRKGDSGHHNEGHENLGQKEVLNPVEERPGIDLGDNY